MYDLHILACYLDHPIPLSVLPASQPLEENKAAAGIFSARL
jgi:hypothetical protein